LPLQVVEHPEHLISLRDGVTLYGYAAREAGDAR
jgi:hypothetical protein